MTHKKASEAAIAFCEKLNDGTSAKVLTVICESMGIMFDDDEIPMMTKAGYIASVVPTNRFIKNGADGLVEAVYKLKLGETAVYVRMKPQDEYRVFSGLESMTCRAAHVAEFLDALYARTPGSNEIHLYKNTSISSAVGSRSFTDRVTRLITENEDIRQLAKCEKCLHDFDHEHQDRGTSKGCDVVREAIRKCSLENLIPSEDIKCEMVFIGFIPALDMFVSAWDVEGSENTGNITVAFTVDEFGNVNGYDHGGHDQHRSLDIYDGGSYKFFDKGHHDNSTYDMMSKSTNPEVAMIDVWTKH